MDAAILQAIADKKLPGGVLWLEKDSAAYRKEFGQRALVPQTELMSENTIFDAASLTKVIATTPAMSTSHALGISRSLIMLITVHTFTP